MLMKPILLAVLFSCLLVSCGYWSSSRSIYARVELYAAGVPTAWFRRSAVDLDSGTLFRINVRRQQVPTPAGSKKIIVWKIRPAGAFRPMDDIAPITYGQLNTGWEQEIAQSEPPPPLLDGYVYRVAQRWLLNGRCRPYVYSKGRKLQPYTEDLPESPCKINR